MQTLEQLKSGQLKGVKRLKLSCGLTEFPQEILDLHETLEVLDLAGNHLTHLPDNFAQLQNLRIAFFSDNDFTEFPSVLARCANLEMIGFKSCKIARVPEAAFPPSLRWLILTNNQVTEIPGGIGKCSRLQKVMLAGNKLKQLPSEMAACQNLQLLRISANEIEELPDWLLTMPRLSWLAYAGNPCSNSVHTGNTLPEIHWQELLIKEQLGEGASGVIAKAEWQSRKQEKALREVAVKVFKGEVTSDGLPDSEMAACIAAGTHPNLVRVLGKVCDHPEQKQALVLDLIPSSFRNLGGPPSFETCTRDTYPESTAFSVREVISIASGIASVAAHLHTRGIMHGDLYAHNTLVDDTAHPLFGDFGAATLYNTADTTTGAALERIEVRAFGCLLEDLLMHLTPADAHHEYIPALTKLKQDCMGAEVLKRPAFPEICENIKSIAGTGVPA